MVDPGEKGEFTFVWRELVFLNHYALSLATNRAQSGHIKSAADADLMWISFSYSQTTVTSIVYVKNTKLEHNTDTETGDPFCRHLRTKQVLIDRYRILGTETQHTRGLIF